MSKVDELRTKFPQVTNGTFIKMVQFDFTGTHKYLEYMLKNWVYERTQRGMNYTLNQLMGEVKKFDELLPHHTNKDIYSLDFEHYRKLIQMNEKAQTVKDDKTFVKAEHVDVLYEDDNVIMVSPKTHRGSLKYGAGTTWCTSSKSNPDTFKRYVKNGCLVYLVDKTESTKRNYQKIAFYNNSGKSLSGEIEIYTQNDNQTSETSLVNNGWKPEKLAELMLRYRAYHVDREAIKRAKSKVESLIDAMKNINLDELHSNLKYLEKRGENEFKDVNNLVNTFVSTVEKSLEKFNN
jgi:hypothetical protein